MTDSTTPPEAAAPVDTAREALASRIGLETAARWGSHSASAAQMIAAGIIRALAEVAAPSQGDDEPVQKQLYPGVMLWAAPSVWSRMTLSRGQNDELVYRLAALVPEAKQEGADPRQLRREIRKLLSRHAFEIDGLDGESTLLASDLRSAIVALDVAPPAPPHEGGDSHSFGPSERTEKGGHIARPDPVPSPDQATPKPLFLTDWERADYERRKKGLPELGPLGSATPSQGDVEALTVDAEKRANVLLARADSVAGSIGEQPLPDQVRGALRYGITVAIVDVATAARAESRAEIERLTSALAARGQEKATIYANLEECRQQRKVAEASARKAGEEMRERLLSDTTVERAARAMCIEHGVVFPDDEGPGFVHSVPDRGDGIPGIIRDHHGPMWKMFVADAKAALAAALPMPGDGKAGR